MVGQRLWVRGGMCVLNVFWGVGGKMHSKEGFGELLWKDCWRFFFFKMLYILPKMLCQLYVTSDSECYIFPLAVPKYSSC